MSKLENFDVADLNGHGKWLKINSKRYGYKYSSTPVKE